MKLLDVIKISPFFRYYVLTMFKYEKKYASKEQRKKVAWAHKRGFTYNKAMIYGINEDNYKDYLSDVEYYKMHQINSFSFWIDDKLTLMHVLRDCKEFLPKYYFHIPYDGRILPLLDMELDLNKEKYSADDIIKLIEKQGKIVCKPLNSSRGQGLYIISYENDSFYVNEDTYKKEELRTLIGSLKNYLVEEYVAFSEDIPADTDSIRVVVINENGLNPQIICTMLWNERLGETENYYKGYVINCDVETGKFVEAKYVNVHKDMECTKREIFINNEETYVGFEPEPKGEIPNWSQIKGDILTICKKIPQISYMGIDIIVTEKGFKILEINSHQDIIWQNFVPLLKKNTVAYDFFSKIRES